MQLVGSFFRFAQRVLEAAKQGKLPGSDQKKLEHLLTQTGKRNLVLAKGLLSALDAGGAKPEDIQILAKLLGKANERITKGKEPFTASEKGQLEELFVQSYLSRHSARWFTRQMDEFLLTEIDEFIHGKRMLTVPSKKAVSFDIEKKKHKTVKT